MKFKIILNGREQIISFVSAVQMLAKHGDRLIFISTKDKVTILVEKPIVWVDIDIISFADSYAFNGYYNPEVTKDSIYFDIIAKHALFPLEALITSQATYAEISLIKNNTAPFLRVYTEPGAEQKKGTFDSQIPVIIIPLDQWSTINIPRDLSFDSSCKTPRYQMFRNYIDIYRVFKSMKFRIKTNAIALQGGSKIDSEVFTYFQKLKPRNDFGVRVTEDVGTIVDSRRLSGFFHSINALCSASKLEIMCRIKHAKYLKIDFQSKDGLIQYNFVLENIEEFEENGSDAVFDKYREDLKVLDTQKDLKKKK